MISVRVNEILKYLSSDKKERLKRCVQMESSQKLDNSRTHRNNVVNALSSSSTSSSSSSVSVGVDAGPEEQLLLGSAGSYQMPPTSSGWTVDGAGDEELKACEKFHNNSGENEFHTTYKKRRPLTVLKSQNVQCLPSSYTSPPTPDTSLSLAPNSLFIPANDDRVSSSRDVKQLNGYKYVAPTKSDTKSKNRGGAVSRGQLQVDFDSVKRKTKESHKETSDAAGTAPKGKSKQIENRKHSKRKTGSSSAVTAEAEAPVVMTVTKEAPRVGNRSLSAAESIDHNPHPSSPPSLGSGTSSPSCVSSRRSKRQSKQKEGAAADGRSAEHVASRSEELSEDCDVASTHLGNAKSKTSSKLNHSVDDHSKGLTMKEKDRKLDRTKNNCAVWPDGYTSTSGVAELDTFEIASLRNQKLSKRVTADKRIADHINISSSNEVNALDTFDEPVVRPVSRRSFDASSLSVQQKQRSSDAVSEKWIQVNRKVKRVVVPSSVVSHILGSNGSKLEAICQVTRAHIELEKTTNSSETTFVLRGSLEQMQAASNMISALVKDSSKSSSDSSSAKTGNIAPQAKNGCSPQHLPPQTLVATTPPKDLKLSPKSGQSPIPLNNAITEKCATVQGVPQVNGVGQYDDEDYPESILSSASEERSDPCSERCSPAQDLLVGEYSLFEHGLGQPLEKLLARKDSNRQTFARAAAVRTPSRPLAPIIANRSAIDQLLLAKAPGYRNAKAMYARDACYAKAADLGMHGPIGRFGWQSMAISGRGLERAKENDPFRYTTSQPFSIDSLSNAHIPLLERPLSAPGFPSARSSSSSAALPPTPPNLPPPHDRCSAAPDHRLLTPVQTFSNLNPNAPDFVFTLPLEEVSANRLIGAGAGILSFEPCGSRLMRSPVVDHSADGSGCADGSAGEFSYSMARLSRTFEPTSVEMPDPSGNGGGGQDGGFARPRTPTDDGMYAPVLGGDNLIAPPWLCSAEPWLPSKMFYSGMGLGEQGLPTEGGTSSIASYPSRGDLYRNYFVHPPFSPMTSPSPYNCAFYEQQNMMLAPVQSWNHAAQTVAAQVGP